MTLWTWVERSDGMDIWEALDDAGVIFYNVTAPWVDGTRVFPRGESSLRQIREARIEALWMALEANENYGCPRRGKLDMATRRRICYSAERPPAKQSEEFSKAAVQKFGSSV